MPSFARYGNIIEQIKQLSSTLGNCLVYALPKRVVLCADFDAWLENLPLYLESVFQKDFMQ